MAADRMRPGQVVRSQAGRDQGRYFLVMAVLDDRYVMVADGKQRKVESPKKKNVKHLAPMGIVAETLTPRLAAGERVTNAEVRRALRELAVAEVPPEGEEPGEERG